MALTNDDLNAVRSVVRDETKDLVKTEGLAPFAIKADLAKLATKEDVLDAARKLEAKIASKEDLLEAEVRLTKKIEFEIEKLARMTVKESARLRKRDEELARHLGYTFDPEPDE